MTVEPAPVNPLPMGTVCQASVNTGNCRFVFDGIIMYNSPTWQFQVTDPADNQWITLTFPYELEVTAVRIMGDFVGQDRNIEDVELTFSNDTSQQVSGKLTCRERFTAAFIQIKKMWGKFPNMFRRQQLALLCL